MAQTMTDGFNVYSGQLLQKRQQVGDMVGRIKSQLGNLDDQMQQLFQQWLGQSSAGFQQLHNNWQTQYQKLNNQLNVIGQNLETTQKSYLAADANNKPSAS